MSVDFSVSALSGYTPFDVSFIDQTVVAGATVIAWLWDFGDGTTSQVQNPSHTYLVPGDFTVSLNVTFDVGNGTTGSGANLGTGGDQFGDPSDPARAPSSTPGEGYKAFTPQPCTLQQAVTQAFFDANQFFVPLGVPQSNCRLNGSYLSGNSTIVTDDSTGGRAVGEWFWDGVQRNPTATGSVVKPALLTVDSGLGVLLPELMLPSTIPPFLANGHSVQFIDIYGNVSWSTGEDSKRMLYTAAPRILSVSLDLSAAQMTDFYNWFEGPCSVGTEWFSCLLANFGPGLLWFKARFYTPYIATPDTIGTRWEVKFTLYVLGEGQFTPPARTSFVSARGLLLDTAATPRIDRRFKSRRSLLLTTMNYAFKSQRHFNLS